MAKRRSRGQKQRKIPADGTEILAEAGGVRITEGDVDQAIREARERVGDELAELLEAPAMTKGEMEALNREGPKRENDAKSD